MIWDRFEPSCLKRVEAAFAVDELLATHVDWAVRVAEDDASTSADDEDAYEEDEEKEKKGGQDDEQRQKNEERVWLLGSVGVVEAHGGLGQVVNGPAGWLCATFPGPDAGWLCASWPGIPGGCPEVEWRR